MEKQPGGDDQRADIGKNPALVFHDAQDCCLHGGGLFEGDVLRLPDQPPFAGDDVLGECASPSAMMLLL